MRVDILQGALAKKLVGLYFLLTEIEDATE